MTIIVDSRQQTGKHDTKHEYMESLGINLMSSKLPIGDYARIDNMSVVVDTKKDVLELLQNLNQDHSRFKTECIKAMVAGIKLIILIEEMPKNADIRNWRSPCYKSDGYKIINDKRVKTHSKGDRISNASPTRAYRTMFTMSQKYGVVFEFVDKKQSGKRIVEILKGQDIALKDND